MNLLKENWFKVGILIILLIGVYFFSLDIWQKQRYYNLQNEIKRCEELSMKWDYELNECRKFTLQEYLKPKK
tara:strand:- start:109 stop:324 length:216 start_codon:yes stop_codon:yes gene_type:complete